MLLDANILLYATDSRSRFHQAARSWLLDQLGGTRRVGLPWQSLGAFLRLVTHPRVSANPLSAEEAWHSVDAWLASPVAWIPQPGPEHPALLGELLVRHEATGNLVPDLQLAALALEHGLAVCSADSDFARFDEVRWHNPLG